MVDAVVRAVAARLLAERAWASLEALGSLSADELSILARLEVAAMAGDGR
jgi:hypothetical protein